MRIFLSVEASRIELTNFMLSMLFASFEIVGIGLLNVNLQPKIDAICAQAT